jgi:BMFP domain-containing protein YqiC
MFDTRNDLPANTRTRVIELLNARLADLEAHLHAER